MKTIHTPIFHNIKKLIVILSVVINVALLSIDSIYAADISGLGGGHYIRIKGSEIWSMDSNPLRLVSGSHSLMGFETNPEFILGDITPTYKIYLDTLVNHNIYDNSDFNTTNLHETLGLFKSNQRWSVGSEWHFDYDTTRTNEIISFGVAAPNVRHMNLSMSPQIMFDLTPTDTLSLSGNLAQVKYNHSAFIDYKLFSINPSYAYNFTPNNTGLIIMNFQRYQSDSNNKARTDNIGPSFGWTSSISSRISTRITAGIEKSRQISQISNYDTSQLNHVFSASGNFKGQQDITSLTASRLQQPFGNGSSSLLTSFDIKEAHSLNKRITLNASSHYSYTDYSSSSGINLDNQFKLSGGVDYHLLNDLDLTTKYHYINQKLTGTSGSVKEQILLIGIEYNPNFNPL